ncbi:MAG: TetR/AcrR family transcriptional regulator [Gemmatimonadota bacterium]
MERSNYDEKLALILRTAAGVFAEKGYHQASIRDISRATGVSLSGLYYYFNSKEELLFLIQDQCFRTVLDNLDELIAHVEEPRRRLRLLVENHLRFFVGNMNEMKVLSHEADLLTGDYRRRVDDLKRRYSRLCAEMVEALKPADSGVDVRVATFALFGMMNWIYNWYRPGRDVPVEKLAEDMTRLFLEGHLGIGDMDAAPDVDGPAGGDESPSIWRH